MKTERKFTWCVRYYDVKSGSALAIVTGKQIGRAHV